MTALTGDLIDPEDEEINIRRGKGPFSPDEERQIGRWIAANVARNEIVRRTGRANGTISRLAKKNGWEFNRTKAMVPALIARTGDLRAKRLDLKEKLLDDSLRLRAQLWEPCELVMLNNRTGEFARTMLGEPNFADKRNIMTAVGIAVDKHADLERVDAPQDGKNAIIELATIMRLTVPLDAEGKPLLD